MRKKMSQILEINHQENAYAKFARCKTALDRQSLMFEAVFNSEKKKSGEWREVLL